eukprot:3732170-Pyramimonas_sp.AAC.1
MAVFAVFMLSEAVTSRASPYARRFTLSRAERTIPFPYKSDRRRVMCLRATCDALLSLNFSVTA